ncbi:MAG: polysaccharide export periplasmic protein, partial [Cyanobacteria bacterium K_Offshore_0m_m2_072]|nr:polysaccharide export periplasmic protein [Cyanobacteria bacterium K_Offshore_0m_m2_072]
QLRVVYDSYILGPGDAVQVELLDVPEYSGMFTIGPDGTLYLPRLRALYVEGLTVEELRYFLNQQFKTYVRNPDVYVRPVTFRPIRVYVGGEVRRPGYYYLSGQQAINDTSVSGPTTSAPTFGGSSNLSSQIGSALSGAGVSGGGGLASLANSVLQNLSRSTSPGGAGAAAPSTGGSLGSLLGSNPLQLPTVFDAIRAGLGVTPFSNLSEVTVTRRQPLSAGGGKVRADLDFLRLITQGDESQNIRLFDGDIVVVGKSAVEMREQVLQAAQTNLSPDRIEVFVSGRVKAPGTVVLPQGASLNQALMAAGGLQLLRGPVEFIRFTKEGKTDRRVFGYSASATTGDFKNPVLMAGDIVRVDESLLSATVGVMNEITGPVLSVYSLYRIFQP